LIIIVQSTEFNVQREGNEQSPYAEL